MMRPRAGLLAIVLALWSLPGATQEAQSTPSGHARLLLNSARQITQGLHHWQGPNDVSLEVDMELRGGYLLVSGVLQDDFPFIQPRITKINPSWWKMEYGADGVRFLLRQGGPDEKTRIDFYLDYSSQALDPQVVVLQSENQTGRGIKGSRIKFARTVEETRFRLFLPANALLKEPLSLENCVLEVRLYDLDGDEDQYTVLRDQIVLPGKEEKEAR